jgi:hypothetical protein
MAHWPVKKSKAVLTGLWKRCGILQPKNSERRPERQLERRSPRSAEHKNCRITCRADCRVSDPTPDPTARPTVSLSAVCFPVELILCGYSLCSSRRRILSCHSRLNEAVQRTVTLWCQHGNVCVSSGVAERSGGGL